MINTYFFSLETSFLRKLLQFLYSYSQVLMKAISCFWWLYALVIYDRLMSNFMVSAFISFDYLMMMATTN